MAYDINSPLVKRLRRENGATGEQLQRVTGRDYVYSAWSIRPIVERCGLVFASERNEKGELRYFAREKPVAKKAAASAMPKAARKVASKKSRKG